MAPTKPSSTSNTTAPRRSVRFAGSVVPDSNAHLTKPQSTHKTTTTKMPRPQPIAYECSTCYDDLPSRSFPDDLCSFKCAHLINTCKKCIKQYITHQVNVNRVDHIRCPECTPNLDNSFVKDYATAAAYKRYDRLERRIIAEKTPGWHWCLNPRCWGGQVHEPSVGIPKQETLTESDRVFTRHECGHGCCMLCDRAQHEGSCDDDRNRKEEEPSLAAVQKVSKACSGCTRPIEKIGGIQYYAPITHAEGCMYRTVIDPHAAPAGGLLLYEGWNA